MEVLNKLCLERFMRKHPDARAPLQRWLEMAEGADWRCFDDVRTTFSSADGGVRTGSGKPVEVFNVHGNDYRLITRIIYAKRRIVVLDVMKHPEYNTGHWKKRM